MSLLIETNAKLPGPSRRHVLQGVAMGSALALTGPVHALAQERRIETIGLQLYTLRHVFKHKPADCLRRVAEIGYREVEFAGFFNETPASLRGMLDDFGLKAPAAHFGYAALSERPDEAFEAAKILGCHYVVVPWLPLSMRDTADKLWATADLFNRVGEKTKEAGLTFAYHNHGFEFQPIEGVILYDVLLTRTDPALVSFEIDFYWSAKAGRNALELFNAYPGRFPLAHMKDMAADQSMADVGAGTLDFALYLAKANEAGLKHFFVERDDAPKPYFPSIEASYRVLRELRF